MSGSPQQFGPEGVFMEGRRVRALSASIAVLGLLGVAAAPAMASPNVLVSKISSLKAGAMSGTLHGTVVNKTAGARNAQVAVQLMRWGTKAPVVGRAKVFVGAAGSADFSVKVKLPGSTARGNYYLTACTPSGTGAGEVACASTADDVLVKGGRPIRGIAAARAVASKTAHAAAADCSSGAHTLVAPGERVYPEAGNGGYQSLHTDVYTVYDALTNLLLPGTHVVHQQRSTQCLTDFSLDFDAHNAPTIAGAPGTDMTVQSITVNGQPATFALKQPTYPGDPKGQDDPDPLAHPTGLTIPISANNPTPPACAPALSGTAGIDQPCLPTKLVITPAAPIPSGTDFTVQVNYTGRPGARAQGDGRSEGWFRNATVGGEGAMVTTEPMGTMAWMPMNDHTRVKPTYYFYDTVTKGKVAIGNGRLVSTGDNAPDANFPNGSTSWHWHSSEPVAAYLVENSIGSFDWNERAGANGVLYYEAQDSNIAAARKALNKVAMDQQEDITHFQEGITGTFPFSANGILVMQPNASFEKEMQTKIVFVNGTIGGNNGLKTSTFAHENMHQWCGANVSSSDHRYTFFKEGQARTAEYYWTARNAATAAGGQGTTAGDAAYEASLVTSFNNNYASTGSFWMIAPSNPTSATLFGTSNTYTRPGITYLALRAVQGKDSYNAALQHIQQAYGGGSISEPQLKNEFHKYFAMDNVPACRAKLEEFFREWWDTAYPSGGGVNKPLITGPGLAGGGFYDATGGCVDPAIGVTQPSATVPATLSLTLGTPAAFGGFTPGVTKDYTATTTANVISTAGDASLSIIDSASAAPG